jgi:hypothetical protein
MVDVKTRVDGVVVYWSLATFFSRERLLSGWSPLGLGTDVPEQRAKVSCLKDALHDVFGSSRVLIRPHAGKNGFSVVKERRGEEDNTYATVLTAKVYENSSAPVFAGDVSKADEVNAAYHQHFGRIPSQQMGAALVRVLQRMGATRLRPTGGIYWLPGSRLSEWESAMAAVENAADGGTAVGYAITHQLDGDSVKAVRDAIVHEVTSEAKRLTEEILSGDLGEKAIKSRKAEAAVLKRKVSEYEQLLGVGLDRLRKTLDSVEQTDAVAALLIAADPFESEEVSNVLA